MKITFTGREVNTMNNAASEVVTMIKEVAPEIDTKGFEADMVKSLKDTKVSYNEVSKDGSVTININDEFIIKSIMFTVRMLRIFMPFVSLMKATAMTAMMLFKGINAQVKEEAIRFQQELGLGAMTHVCTFSNTGSSDDVAASIKVEILSGIDSTNDMEITIEANEPSDAVRTWVAECLDGTILKVKETEEFSFNRKMRLISSLRMVQESIETSVTLTPQKFTF